MDNALLASIIGAGAQVGTSVAQMQATNNIGSDTRGWNEKMYGQQRMDALADRDYNNWYNSPAKIMGRLKDAGLNPNLIAGSMAGAGMSQMPRQAEAKAWNPPVPDLSGFANVNPLRDYNNFQLQKANIDNLQAQKDQRNQEIALKTAQTAGVLVTNAKRQFDLDQALQLKEISLDYAKENLRKLQADTQFTLDENLRKAASNSATLRETIERTILLQKQQAQTDAQRNQIDQQLRNARIDELIKQEDLKLKQKGIQPGDNMLYRTGAEILQKVFNSPTWNNAKESIKSKLYEWGNIAPWFR